MSTTRSATSSASSWSWVTKIDVMCELVVQAPQPAAQLLADLGVERTERLVEQSTRGSTERAREGYALALPAGKLRGSDRPAIRAARGARRSATLDRISDSWPHAARPYPKAEGDVLEHREVAERA